MAVRLVRRFVEAKRENRTLYNRGSIVCPCCLGRKTRTSNLCTYCYRKFQHDLSEYKGKSDNRAIRISRNVKPWLAVHHLNNYSKDNSDRNLDSNNFTIASHKDLHHYIDPKILSTSLDELMLEKDIPIRIKDIVNRYMEIYFELGYRMYHYLNKSEDN